MIQTIQSYVMFHDKIMKNQITMIVPLSLHSILWYIKTKYIVSECVAAMMYYRGYNFVFSVNRETV